MTGPRQQLLVATMEAIAGWRVVRTLGYVDSSNGVEDLAARAEHLSANAVVATRWDRAFQGNGFSALVYGTAVKHCPRTHSRRREPHGASSKHEAMRREIVYAPLEVITIASAARPPASPSSACRGTPPR